jgi:hypothetical protein
MKFVSMKWPAVRMDGIRDDTYGSRAMYIGGGLVGLVVLVVIVVLVLRIL